MDNTRENAEKFLVKFGGNKSLVDKLSGIYDFVDLLTEYGVKIENDLIPNDAHSLEVFSIKDSENSPTGKEAFIGFKLNNNNFNFVSVPFTEPKKEIDLDWTKKKTQFYGVFCAFLGFLIGISATLMIINFI